MPSEYVADAVYHDPNSAYTQLRLSVFMKKWAPEPLKRLQALAPEANFVLGDVIAVMMFCGYESVIKGRGKTEFCKASIFDAEDYKNFEYWFDLIYHKVNIHVWKR